MRQYFQQNCTKQQCQITMIFAEINSEAAIYNLSRTDNYIPQILLKRRFKGNEYEY